MSKQTVAVSLMTEGLYLYKQFSGGLVFATQAINYRLLITVNTPLS